MAHIRRRNPGLARKPDDLVAVRACSDCHAEIDLQVRRVAGLDDIICEALRRTLGAYAHEGILALDPDWWESFPLYLDDVIEHIEQGKQQGKIRNA